MNTPTYQAISYYFENDTIAYDEKDEQYLERIASSYRESGRSPPFSLDRPAREMELSDGYVGIIRLPSRVIIIRPRYYVFSFNVILKMWLFTRYSVTEGTPLLPRFDIEMSSFATDICSIFVKEVKKLLQVGICGDYSLEEDFSQFIKGKIDFAKSVARYPRDNLYCCYDQFSVDITLNRTILYCLFLIQHVVKDPRLSSELTSVLNAFRGVTLRKNFTSTEIDNIVLTRRTAHYQTVLDLCKMIIDHLSIADIGRTVEFYSFLVDYNKLFEDFIGKLLQDYFGKPFTKWPSPRVFAFYRGAYGRIEKRFLPDMLYDYNTYDYSAKIILDVKNKMNIFSNPDIFQMVCYCYLLRAKYGVFVYPSSSRREPKDITVRPLSGDGELFLTSIFFDLNEMLTDFASGRRNFVSDVKQVIARLFS